MKQNNHSLERKTASHQAKRDPLTCNFTRNWLILFIIAFVAMSLFEITRFKSFYTPPILISGAIITIFIVMNGYVSSHFVAPPAIHNAAYDLLKIVRKSGTASKAEAQDLAAKRKTDTTSYLFRHSPHDIWLVLLSVWNIIAVTATALNYDTIAPSFLFCIAVYLIYMNSHNYQCIAHNFIHNPFFKKKWANNAFSVINSVSFWMPQTFFKLHHFNHHRYNNDFQNPKTGKTSDKSSIFRHAKKWNKPEGLLSYAFLSPFRIGFSSLYSKAENKGLAWLINIEATALIFFIAFILWIDWKFCLLFFLPVIYLGNVLAQAQNYFEHFGADPRNRMTNSVSAYGKLYNFVWFNNGYHQEHHFRPGTHWLDLPKVRIELPPDHDRQVIKNGSHLANMWNVITNQGMHTRNPERWQ